MAGKRSHYQEPSRLIDLRDKINEALAKTPSIANRAPVIKIKGRNYYLHSADLSIHRDTVEFLYDPPPNLEHK